MVPAPVEYALNQPLRRRAEAAHEAPSAAPFLFAPEHAAVEVAFAVVRAETFDPPAGHRIVRADTHIDPPYAGDVGGGMPDGIHQQVRIEIAMAELGRGEEVIRDGRGVRNFHPLADVGEKTRALALDHPAVDRQTSVLGTGIDMLAGVEAAAPQRQQGLTGFTRA